MNIKIAMLFVITTFLFSNCKRDENIIDDSQSVLNKEVLSDLSNGIITETYKTMYLRAVDLNDKVGAMGIGDQVVLDEARQLWRDTRNAWEQSEGFLFGPVDNEGIDPAIDSWPVDVNAIDNILNSSNEINSSLLESNNEARGFHTIEYFLWGINGNKTANDFTLRELAYLKAATQNLEDKTLQLYHAWAVEQGNYAGNFINAGVANSSIYASQKNALQEIVEGMVIIADEVANGKIETPLNGNNGAAQPEAEESRFSANSKDDFANNIRSIQNLYNGSYLNNQVKGIDKIVLIKNAALDAQIKVKVQDAISAIEAIPGTFTDAIFNNRASVINAQTKVAELKYLLESQLEPLISNL